ncbi:MULTISPECIES: hypothetical protein [unclassified Streptococcus]|uniref:hypothetical protein n=1 Tax=unclassified Streptococcus TaxID=2608887 RepID=UPI001364A7FB|nr:MULTISPECIES: hypothetical protein [unclassified Streptococcus]
MTHINQLKLSLALNLITILIAVPLIFMTKRYLLSIIVIFCASRFWTNWQQYKKEKQSR